MSGVAPGAALADSGVARRVFPATWKLLRLRLQLWWSGLRRGKRRQKLGQIVLALLVVALMAFVFTATRLFLGFLDSPAFANAVPFFPDLAGSIPVMVLGAAFLGVLLTSFGVLLQALYLSGDMDFLLSAPVPIRAVFLSKLLQAIIPNFGLICLLTLPMLFGLGSAEGYNALYYPLVLVVISALALAAAALAAILVMGVVHFFPARRTAEVLGFVGAILAILCSQSGQLANSAELSAAQIQQAATLMSRFDTPWSPIAWAGRGVVQIGEGSFASGALPFLGTIVLSAAAFGIALVAAERLYYSGWASVGIVSTRRRAAKVRRRTEVRTRGASPWRAVVSKDFAVLRRDLRSLSQMVTPLIMGVIYAVLIVRGRGEPGLGSGDAPQWLLEGSKGLLTFGNVAISLFVGWVLSARLATMAFSHEGRSYWILKTSPIRTDLLLLAKYTVAYVPVVVLGCGFLLVLSLARGVSPGDTVFGFLAVALCYAAITGVNLAFGVTGAVFDWEDPRRMIRGSVGCMSSLVSVLTLGGCLALFAGPVVIGGLLGFPDAAGKLIGLGLGGVASVLCAVIPPYLVRSRVPRLAET
jgi:ABC-2 type transport system permease protein